MSDNENRIIPKSLTVYDVDIKMSSSLLQISLQRMYEAGRQSVDKKLISISEILAGAFIAELISALICLFSSKSPELVFQGIIEKPLLIHLIAAVVLGVATAIAYSHKAAMRYSGETDIELRDRTVNYELRTLIQESDEEP